MRPLRIAAVMCLVCVIGLARGADAPATRPVHSLTVTAIDATTGKPLAGAVVSTRTLDGGIDRVTADDVGRAVIRYDAGMSSAGFACRKDGYVTVRFHWEAPPRAIVAVPDAYTVKMQPGKQIGGT